MEYISIINAASLPFWQFFGGLATKKAMEPHEVFRINGHIILIRKIERGGQGKESICCFLSAKPNSTINHPELLSEPSQVLCSQEGSQCLTRETTQSTPTTEAKLSSLQGRDFNSSNMRRPHEQHQNFSNSSQGLNSDRMQLEGRHGPAHALSVPPHDDSPLPVITEK